MNKVFILPKTNSNTREAFGKALLELAERGERVAAIAADTAKSMYLNLMEEKFPDRVFDVGIAEQNMMMSAAGIAADGFRVFATSYAVFTSMRALEQIRTFICYPNLPVTVVSGLGGFTGGVEGVTHLGLEDLGLLRCIGGIAIINPSDSLSTQELIKQTMDLKGPAYVRIGRDNSPDIHVDTKDLRIGKAKVWLEEGDDITLIVTGFPLWQTLHAAQRLRAEGYGVRVLEIHTLRPLDEEKILASISETRSCLVIEEATRTGGLGSAICEAQVRSGMSSLPRFAEVSVPDGYTHSGTPDELREEFGLTENGIYEKALALIGFSK